jgi:hypothetical protein
MEYEIAIQILHETKNHSWDGLKWCKLVVRLRTHALIPSPTDTARPTVFAASSTRQHKCESFPLCVPSYNRLYEIVCYFILRSYAYDRNTSPSTEGKEDAMDARGMKAEVTVAWKRRRKELQAQLHWSLRPHRLTPESPTYEDQDGSLSPTYTEVSELSEAPARSQFSPRPMYPLYA